MVCTYEMYVERTVHLERTQQENCTPQTTQRTSKLESPESPLIEAPATTETLDITARMRELDCQILYRIRHSDSFIIL